MLLAGLACLYVSLTSSAEETITKRLTVSSCESVTGVCASDSANRPLVRTRSGERYELRSPVTLIVGRTYRCQVTRDWALPAFLAPTQDILSCQ